MNWRAILDRFFGRSQRRCLDDRRQGETLTLTYERTRGRAISFDATFNPGADGRIAEAFCLAFQEGADLRHLLHHACIIASVGLQYGATMADFAHAMGEDDLSKAPGSFMAVIARAGAALDAENGFTREGAA